MEKSAPEFYDKSCEKACLTQQHQGGALVEGASSADVTQTGGLSAHGEPPALSWVKGAPYNYIQDSRTREEHRSDQCGRIFAEQTPARAQSIAKSGMMWKRERLWNKWNQRFFAFESGGAARSAVLRYWRRDPTQHTDEPERWNQGIVLWDAQGVKVKSGAGYGWGFGTECFKLNHFYRDYHFCVDASDGGEQARNNWMNLIEKSIVYPNIGRLRSTKADSDAHYEVDEV